MTTRRQTLGALGALAAAPLLAAAARAEGLQVPGIYLKAVGGAVVTALADGFLALDPADLQGADAQAKSAALADAFLPDAPVDTAVNAYVVRVGGRTVVVDSGAGAAFGPTAGDFAALIAADGLDPATVDAVVLTHLHPDHVNGLMRDGAALFPNAALVLHEAERAFWTDDANFAGADGMTRNFVAMARAGLDAHAGRIEPMRDGAEVVPGLTLVHLPGHTPGHCGLRLSDSDAQLLLWGDIVHIGAVQFALPQVTIPFDVDQPQAAATRTRVLDMVAGDRLEFAGSHIAFPSFGRAVRAGSGYRFLPSRWDYRV